MAAVKVILRFLIIVEPKMSNNIQMTEILICWIGYSITSPTSSSLCSSELYWAIKDTSRRVEGINEIIRD